jgi:hypothetical protein
MKMQATALHSPNTSHPDEIRARGCCDDRRQQLCTHFNYVLTYIHSIQ